MKSSKDLGSDLHVHTSPLPYYDFQLHLAPRSLWLGQVLGVLFDQKTTKSSNSIKTLAGPTLSVQETK